jgi:phosphatidate phosphatase APP1
MVSHRSIAAPLASTSAHKSAPPTSAKGKRVVNSAHALHGAAKGAAPALTTVISRDPAPSSKHHRHEFDEQTLNTQPQQPPRSRHHQAASGSLKKIVIRAPSGYASDVVVMWRRWFCGAPSRQALLDHLDVGRHVAWNTSSTDVARYEPARNNSGAASSSSLCVSQLSRLHDPTRLRVALACCRRVCELLTLSSLKLESEASDASLDAPQQQQAAIQQLLKVVVAAVPVVVVANHQQSASSSEHDGQPSESRLYSRSEALHIVDLVRRVAILTESWDLAAQMLPIVKTCAAAGSSNVDGLTQQLMLLLMRQRQQCGSIPYAHHVVLHPLPVPSGGMDAAAIKNYDGLDTVTRIVLCKVISMLDHSATPSRGAWYAEHTEPLSSVALRLRCGMSIDVNRERTIATAFALCDQHRLFGLPATLRFLRKNKQQAAWASHSHSTLTRSHEAVHESAKSQRSTPAALSSFFPSTRHLPGEWFDVKFHQNNRAGELDMDSTVVENANLEILKSVLGKEVAAEHSVVAMHEEAAAAASTAAATVLDRDGIQFVAIAGDVDVMTLLLWDYLKHGLDAAERSSSTDNANNEVKRESCDDDTHEAITETTQEGKQVASKLYEILKTELLRQAPTALATAAESALETIAIAGREHAVPRVSALWVPGSIAQLLGCVPAASSETRPSNGGTSPAVCSLAIVFGVMGTSTKATAGDAVASIADLTDRVFLCSVLELARP